MDTNFNGSLEPSPDNYSQGADSDQGLTGLLLAFPNGECQQADPFSPMNIIRTFDGNVILRCSHDPEHTSQVIAAQSSTNTRASSEISEMELIAAARAKRAIDRRLNRPSEEWVLRLTEDRLN